MDWGFYFTRMDQPAAVGRTFERLGIGIKLKPILRADWLTGILDNRKRAY
jgi:hypothetical protein